jgi:hypothetical protein
MPPQTWALFPLPAVAHSSFQAISSRPESFYAVAEVVFDEDDLLAPIASASGLNPKNPAGSTMSGSINLTNQTLALFESSECPPMSRYPGGPFPRPAARGVNRDAPERNC